MRYEIQHECGHIIEHQVCGRQVEAQIDFLEGHECRDCYARKAADAAEAEFGALPLLRGARESDVTLARRIRVDAARSLSVVANQSLEELDAELCEQVLGVIGEALFEGDCEYWLNQQGREFDHTWVSEQLCRESGHA